MREHHPMRLREGKEEYTPTPIRKPKRDRVIQPHMPREEQIKIIKECLMQNMSRDEAREKARCTSDLIPVVIREDPELSNFFKTKIESAKAKQLEIIKECLKKNLGWEQTQRRARCGHRLIVQVKRENPELDGNLRSAELRQRKNLVQRMALKKKPFNEIVTAVKMAASTVRRYISENPKLKKYDENLFPTVINSKNRKTIKKLWKQKRSYRYISNRVGITPSKVKKEIGDDKVTKKRSQVKAHKNVAKKKEQTKKTVLKRRLSIEPSFSDDLTHRDVSEIVSQHIEVKDAADLNYTSDGERFDMEF